MYHVTTVFDSSQELLLLVITLSSYFSCLSKLSCNQHKGKNNINK